MSRLLNLAVSIAAVAVVVASPALAGMVCRGSSITGFEGQAHRAVVALGDVTSDPAKIEVYAEVSGTTYYYESNFVRPGQRDHTKIVSSVPLSLKQVVQNMMFASVEEIAAHHAETVVALRELDSSSNGGAQLLAANARLPARQPHEPGIMLASLESPPSR